VMEPSFQQDIYQRVYAVIGGEFQILDPRKIRDACTLPHRLILGCSECLPEPENPELHCGIKRLYLDRDDNLSEDVLNAISRWKHLKVKLFGHTFVSPTYTGEYSPFSARNKDHSSIDFDNVVNNVEARKEVAKARANSQKFRVTECSRCLGSGLCESARAKWCYGPYGKTDKEYYEYIIKKTKVPFTNAQIAYLLNNSGSLNHRHNRRLSYLTFRYDGDALNFVIGRMTTGEERSITFKEAKSIIENDVEHPRNLPIKITKKLKALLISAASLSTSPAQGNGWHKTRYDSRSLLLNYPDRLILQFYWRSRHRLLPWEFKCDSLRDIFRHYSRVPRIHQTVSVLRTKESGYKGYVPEYEEED
jgi:hypothetical protein